MPEYATNFDDGMFNYSDHGNCVFRTSLKWDNTPRDDIIDFNKDDDIAELMKGLKIRSMVDSSIRDRIIDIIKTYWDFFCKYGARRMILEYEFAIDTGNYKPVCCKKPDYGPHESKIIIDQVQKLLTNGRIKQRHGPWGSIII